ncbi:MAG: protein kinase, partial [Actinomycetota bacterium]|nr:protein kinase [Actinomycetota bacterium]
MAERVRILGGRYRVDALVGDGGMAQVYRGHDTLLARPVAVKVLASRLARDPAAVARFSREARAAAGLAHPGIVSIFDHGSEGDVHYIVMELVDGPTLANVLAARRALDPASALSVAAAVAGALDAAHAAGIVHRDVKPGNVMLTSTGRIKVTDFGIARAAGVEGSTGTGNVLGTARYLAPEQAQGHAVDGRADVYGLGAVLYELLTGEPPFRGDSPVSVAYKHVHEEPEPPSARRPGLPLELDAIVLRALAKRPEARFPSAAAFHAALVAAGAPATAGT